MLAACFVALIYCLLPTCCWSQGLDVEIQPSGVTILELNDNIVLTCMANDDTYVVAYNFYLEDIIVQSSATDQTLTIQYNDQTSIVFGGTYDCEVLDSMNGVFRSDRKIFIAFAPIITQQPVPIYTVTGESVEFNCTATGLPIPTIRWIRLGPGDDVDTLEGMGLLLGLDDNLPTNSTINCYDEYSDSITSVLTIEYVSFEDFGDYICVAVLESEAVINPNDGISESGSGSRSDSDDMMLQPNITYIAVSNITTLTVSPEGSISVQPLVETANISDTVSFTCSAEGGPNNTYLWVKGQDSYLGFSTLNDYIDSLISLEVGVDNVTNSLELYFVVVTRDSNITITMINGSDGGEYICVAINEAGFDNATVTLYVLPEILQDPENVYVQDGDTVTLTCIADSFPFPYYQWEIMNVLSGEFEPIDEETDTTLVFDYIDYDDYGTYRCEVTTSIINETITSEEAVITVSPNDSVTIEPSMMTVANGSDVTFNCSALGGPNNTFIWVRSDELDKIFESYIQPLLSTTPVDVSDIINELSDIILENGTILFIESINATLNGGSYECVVINEAGLGRNDTTLYVTPVITEQPMDVETEVDMIVTLTCIADSFPAPEYQWEMMNRTSGQFEPIDEETNTTLVFDYIGYDDYGTYRCVVNVPLISSTIISDNVTITVSPFGSIEVDPLNQTASYNSSAMFDCTSEGGPYNQHRWIEGELNLPSPVTVASVDALSTVVSNTTILSLDEVIGSSGGVYTCIAINDAGSDNASVTLYVSPEILQDPMNEYVQDGDTVTLTCEADSFPSPDYQWEIMNMLLGEFEPIDRETNTTLVFDYIDYEDYGTYRCEVTTPTINEVITSEEAVITVSPNDSVTIEPSMMTVDNGNDVTFTCSALGGPNNTFIWVRSDELDDSYIQPLLSTTPVDVSDIINELSDIILENGAILFIESINATLNGGSYECVVINEAGLGRNDTTLYVRPVITQQPMDVETEVDNIITLTCIADSFPAPEYQWEMMNRTSGEFEPIDGETDTTLVFDYIDYEDYGTYRCVVTTPTINETITSEEAVITVSPNDSVTIEPSMMTVDNGSNVTFTCSALGGPNNTFIWVRSDELDVIFELYIQPLLSTTPVDVSDIISKLSDIILENGTILFIESINATLNGGSYECVVINEAGLGRNDTTLYVRPVITQQPMDVETEADDIVTLTCIADSFPAPEYQWEMMNRITGQFEPIDEETDTTLVFDYIDYEDYGTYRCEVTTPIINEVITSEEAVITVSPNDSVTIEPSMMTVDNGSNVTFNCSALGGPNNTFIWVRSDELDEIFESYIQPLLSTTPVDVSDIINELSDIILENGTILFIESINATLNGGSYECVVINEAGLGRNDTTLYVRPVITEQPMDVETEVDNIVTLTCIADSFPAPEYQWEMMNRTSGEFEPIDEETDTTLVFDYIDYDDYGTYRCVVTTPTINETITSEEAVITVSPNDSVTIEPSMMTVDNGSNVTFTCSALGGPNNTFIWVRSDELDVIFELYIQPLLSTTPVDVSDIISELSGIILENGTILFIESINATLNGGSYECVVINEAGLGRNNTTLYVRPVITEQPMDVETEVDNIVILTCIADSFPAPEYQWEMMNRISGEFEPIDGETDTTLVFDYIDYDDYGTYRCEVTTPTINMVITSEEAVITVSPNNSVTIEPSMMTVDNGSNVTFTCSALGGPNNTFIWVRSDELDVIFELYIQPLLSTTPVDVSDIISKLSDIILENGTILFIESINATLNGGSYECVVINEAGLGRNDTTLYVRPVITQQPMDVETEADDIVTLTCIADSFPAPEYQWEMMNRITGQFEPIDEETDTTLVFDYIDYEDYGTYRCEVTTPIINEVITSEEAVITVSPNDSVTIEPSMMTVDNGSNVTFTCSALGGPNNTFIWVRSDELDEIFESYIQPLLSTTPVDVSDIINELSDIILENGTILFIESINATLNGGSYECVVINEAGLGRNDTTLYVRPVITEQPMDVETLANLTVTLTCIADSFPAPVYQWEMMNRTSGEFEQIGGETNTTLVFDSIDYEQYGRYRCVVNTPVIEASVTSNSAVITVSPEGSVIVNPSINNSFNGSNVILTCSARGGPFNRFQWTYLRTGYNVSTETQYTFTSSIYTGGEYECEVSNRAGNETDNAVVNVGPIITMGPESVNVSIDTEDIELNCTVIGVPTPNITWTHNDSVLNSDDMFSDEIFIDIFEEDLGTRLSVLTIVSAQPNNTGDYSCNATSPVEFYESVMSEVVTVLVQDVPDVPVDLNVENVTSRNLTLFWTEPHDNNAPILGYLVMYNDPPFLGGDEVVLTVYEDEQELFIENLHPGVTYDFTVLAFNNEGNSEESDPFTIRTLEEAPASSPQNFTVTSTTPNSISLQWNPPPDEDVNGIIITYIIRYRIIEQLGVDPVSMDMLNINVTGNIIANTLVNLANYTVYDISIGAATAIGEGPTTSLTQRTDQNAPGASPVFIEAVTNSTTSIIITWDAPPLDMTFGIITSYEIQYGRFDTDNMTLMEGTIQNQSIQGNTTFEVEIGSLQEFITYGFQVRAVTVAPGPYTDFAVNTTFQAPPAVAPVIPPNPVPNNTRTPTSVLLRWEAIPPDEANGELTYIVMIAVTGQTRRKRQTNSLQQCLEAAGITNQFDVSVPGNQTSTTLTDIAPFTGYSYTVSGNTSAGLGPSSASVLFSTPEGTPTATREVLLVNTSSTSLQLTWEPPICDNGIRIGYTIFYSPLSGPDPIGEMGDRDLTFDLGNPNAVSVDLTGLTPNSPYEVTICARTSTGCGVNITVSQTTTQDSPQAVTNQVLRNSTVNEISVTWTNPSDRNGSFNIELNYKAIQIFPYPSRINSIMDTTELSSSRNSFVIMNTLPYAEYVVTLVAFNRLFGRSLSSPPVTQTIISQPIKSTEVTNLTATTRNASSIFVMWDLPLNPNGEITFYNVSYCETCFETSRLLYHTIQNLTAGVTYSITVQPVTIFENLRLIGDRSSAQTVTINTTARGVVPSTSALRVGASDIRVSLPSPSLFGENVLFYGVGVAEDNPDTGADLGELYPDPQPSRNGRNYYISAGWDNTSLVPDEFDVGGGGETEAVRNGVQETYTNRDLEAETSYCIFVIVYLDSGVEGEPIIRYAKLLQIETNEAPLGYSVGALAFFMVLIFLIIIGVIVGVILFFLYRRYKTEFYSLIHKKKRAIEPDSINGGGIVLVNPPVNDIDDVKWIDPSNSREPIHVNDFPDHVANMHSNDDYIFSVEYPTVEPRHAPTTEATHHPDNAVKNRYANITAYDHSRVRLEEIPNTPGSDYINANFIDGYKSPNAFIASQGPVPHSIPDFWRMIWEQGTATIVMLTNLEEKGRVKCHMYWPASDKRVQVYGLIRVHLQEELKLSDHTIRTFSLQKDKSGDERIVKQYHFTSWPDFGVPEHPTPLLRFIHKVDAGDPVNAGPMVIHCSAGVGRTGTFITIQSQMKRIKDVETVDIYNFVHSMRYRRCFMVQTEAQYIFIHDALLEVIECGETEVSARELKEQYRKLSTFNDVEGLLYIEQEYEKIQDTIHTEPIRYAGTLPSNRQKNRFHNVIPFDKTRCRLSAIPGMDGSDYINGNFIDGYHKGKAFIASQGPLPDTCEDFWRMIWEHKSSTIVMLSKEKEGKKVMCHRYWPDEDTGSEMHGPFDISLHSVREYPDYVLREIKIVDTRDDEGSSQHIKQFHFTGWPSEGVPSTAIGMLDVRDQVEKWQRNSGDKPIIVHCSGGCGRTGTYIAMCLLIDRLKTEGVVDVFQTVRGLRLQRPGMVRSVDQYDFVYKALLEYLGSFDTYANFSL